MPATSCVINTSQQKNVSLKCWDTSCFNPFQLCICNFHLAFCLLLNAAGDAVCFGGERGGQGGEIYELVDQTYFLSHVTPPPKSFVKQTYTYSKCASVRKILFPGDCRWGRSSSSRNSLVNPATTTYSTDQYLTVTTKIKTSIRWLVHRAFCCKLLVACGSLYLVLAG